ncbi:hypothetical protein [Spirosoma flavus]
MNKILQTLIAISMVITWIATFFIAFGSPSLLGKTSILASGLLINVVLGIVHSFVKTRAGSFQEWLSS